MNWPTVIVALVIAGILAAIVVTGIINKKKGKRVCSCGGSCGSCGMGDCCPSKKGGTTQP